MSKTLDFSEKRIENGYNFLTKFKMIRDKLISVRVDGLRLVELRKEQEEFGYKTLGRYVFSLLADRQLVVNRRREITKRMSEL